jgi:hypothetical protein
MVRRGGTEKIGDVIAGLLQRRGYARPLALAGFRDAWNRAAGERLAGRSRVSAFRDGTLTIEVTSSAQRYELEAFSARQLLVALQGDNSIPTVRKLVFRVGNPAT